MSRNVKRALVNQTLCAKHKTSSRIVSSHYELCGGRGTRTHKPFRATIFKTVRLPVTVALRSQISVGYAPALISEKPV